MPANAQEAEVEPEEDVIVVTGSRLPSTDLTAAAPVTVLDRGEIEATGAQSVGELLRELPVASASASDSAGRGNNGSANIALRGLSPINTLVLVNGRRMLSNNSDGTVDLNSVPFEAIERMEVLQDGASAIYGSDAISGVVNLIMRRSYDGLQLKAGYGFSSRGDLPNFEASGTFGREFDNGGFIFNVSYRKSGGNLIADRPISRDPDWRALGGRNFRDQAPLVGAFRAVDPANGFADGNPYYIIRDGIDQVSSAGDLRPMVYPDTDTPLDSGNDGINYWQYESSASKISQLNFWFAGEHEIVDGLKAFVEASYNTRNSLGFLAPDYFDPSSGTNPDGSSGIQVSADNPFNPFGFDVYAIRTLQELGRGRTRMNDVNSKMYRIVGGLEGEIGSLWKWDISANFQKLDMYTDGGNSLDTISLQRAVGDPDICAATAGCIPVNLFGGPGSITQEMLDSITSPRWRDVNANLKSFVGNVTGKLFELPAGDVNIALGAEYRTESYEQIQDNAPEKQTPTPPFLPPERRIYEFYAETALPLLKDIPFIYSLDVEGAVRHSHYNAFGSTTNPKVGVKWRPYADLMLRGSWGTGFRAPTFNEANSTQSRGYRPLTDPCQGAEYASFPVCGGQQAPVLTGAWVITGGNPDLKPETAETLTVGAVWTPNFIPRFSVTVDYFEISKSNIIGVADPDYIIAQNALGADFPGQVVRDINNSIYEVYAIRDNLLDQSISGLDFGVEYNTGEASWGSLNLRADATYLDSYTLSPAPDTPAVERVGTYTTALGTIPRWKATGRATWTLDDLQVTYGTRYVGPVRNDASLLVNGEHLRADSYLQHDIAVSYFIEPMDMKLTAAVENFTDEMPPWLEGNYYNGFDEKTFNSRGRFFSFRIQKDF